MCNTVHTFRNRMSIFGCRKNPSCHRFFPSRARVLSVPRPPGKMLNMAPNVVNYTRTTRILGVVNRCNRILDNGL